jgi:hypothetical protein
LNIEQGILNDEGREEIYFYYETVAGLNLMWVNQ